MLYFENSKNRNILALLFTCFALLESIFFGFAIEELYSFLYPFMIDMLSVFIIACLCYFLDFKRKMNAVFIFIATFTAVLFIELCKLYFKYGSEVGFYKVPTLEFFKSFFITIFVHILCLVSYGILKTRYTNTKLLILIPVSIFFIYLIVSGDFIHTALISLSFVFAFFFQDHLIGKNIKLNSKHIILLFILFFICLFFYFSYRNGVLLTQEASSFVNLLIILAGIILAICKKRYGLYLIEFISVYMALPYINVSIKNKDMIYNLLGIIPLILIGFGSIFVNHSLDKRNDQEDVS